MVFKLLGPLINHCLCLLTLIAYINPMGLWLVLLYWLYTYKFVDPNAAMIRVLKVLQEKI